MRGSFVKIFGCIALFAVIEFSIIANDNTVKSQNDKNIILKKNFLKYMLCDTAGNLRSTSEIFFDGSILFDYGQWNSTGLPIIFRIWNCVYVKGHHDSVNVSQLLHITNAFPFINNYAVVQRGNKFNLINSHFNLIGEKWFDYVGDFSEGLAVVGKGRWVNGNFVGQLGYMDTLQNMHIPQMFEYAEPFKDGVAKAILSNRVIYIDKKGKPVRKTEVQNSFQKTMGLLNNKNVNVVRSPEFYDFENYTFKHAVDSSILEPRKGSWVFTSHSGMKLLEVKYDYVLKFNEGFAPVKKDNKWNYIDFRGHLLFNEWFDDIEAFNQGLAYVKKDGKRAIIAFNGKYVIPFMYPVKNFSGGRACIEMPGKYGKQVTYIDRDANPIISWMSGATTFHNGKAEIKREDGMYATIDTIGNIIDTWHYKVLFEGDMVDVLECNDKYTLRDKAGKLVYSWLPDVELFPESFMAIKKNNKWGFIDKYGKTLLAFEYDECWDFKDALAKVKNNNKFTFIDKNGRNIANDWFDAVGNFSMDRVAVQKKGKWGFINNKGEMVVKPQFAAASSFIEGFALVKKGGYFGYINLKGKKLTNFEFTSGGNFSNGIAFVKKGKISGYIDRTGQFFAK